MFYLNNSMRNKLFEDIKQRQAQEAVEHEARRKKAMARIKAMREELRQKQQKERA